MLNDKFCRKRDLIKMEFVAGKDIKIKDYPNDVYKAVGKIIMYAQKWEQEFKKLATILQIPIKKIDTASSTL